MQDPSAAARRYLDHLTVERGLADNTLEAYRRDLERYVAFLRRRGIDDLGAVDPPMIRGFVASISASTHGPDEEAYKATSVARTLSAVRTFHRFALREGLVTDDPTAGVVRPRLPRGLPHPLTVDEVAAVIDAPPEGTPAGVRDRAILELLYGAGLRVSELTGLDVDDVDLEEGAVRVLGKGSKERDVPIGRMARDAIDAYLRTARPALAAGALPRSPVPERPRREAHATIVRSPARHARPPGRDPPNGDATRPATLLRDAPAGRGSRRARRAGAARTRQRGHHADLHAGDDRAPALRV